jgi:hypothetical protein
MTKSYGKLTLAAFVAVAVTFSGTGWWTRHAAEPAANASDAPRSVKKEAKDAEPITGAVAIAQALSKVIEYPGTGGPDPRLTLQELLCELTKLSGVDFEINTAAFLLESTGLDWKLHPIAGKESLPKLKGKLRHVLEKLLKKVNNPSGASFLVRADHIEITTVYAVRREVGVVPVYKPKQSDLEKQTKVGRIDLRLIPLVEKFAGKTSLKETLELLAEYSIAPEAAAPGGRGLGGFDPMLRLPAAPEDAGTLLPLVFKNFSSVELTTVLASLADDSGFNVVIDSRFKDKKDKINARLINVPVDTALRVVAELVGLSVVRMDNVFYLTSRERARSMAKEKAATASGERPGLVLPPDPESVPEK